MTKHIGVLILIIFCYLPSLNAQVDICDIFWWQQITPEEVRMLTIENNDFYGQCANGETPIIMAAEAGVDRVVLRAVFELIARNAIAKSLHTQSRFGDDGQLYLLDKSNDPTERLNIDVQVNLREFLELNSN